MTTLADPDTRFPGLADGMAASVAAVVEAGTAEDLWVLVAHLRDGGCPDPARVDLLAKLVDRVEIAAYDAEHWTDELRDVVVDACVAVEDLIDRVLKVTR